MIKSDLEIHIESCTKEISSHPDCEVFREIAKIVSSQPDK